MSKAITPRDEIGNNLERMAPEFSKALPAHVPVKKFIRVAQTAITTNPTLMKCDRTSLWAALTKAAEVGLMPDGREAAIVPFKDKAQFMSMVAGKMKLARNSGEIKTLDAQVVYEKDEFQYWIDDDGSHINHKPYLDGSRGNSRLAYAVGVTKDGGKYVEVMTKDQLKAVENVSRGKGGPWSGAFRSEMERKSVMNRLLKRMPSSTDIDLDMENDYQLSDVNPDPEPEPEQPQEKEVKAGSRAAERKDTTAPNKLTELIENKDEEEVPI